MTQESVLPIESIERRIFVIRGQRVRVDRHLAELYGVTTMALNQAVKRNEVRFPQDFMFRLTQVERDEVITICDNLRVLRFSPAMPYAFSENGIAMLSTVLRSKRAILVNIQIMRTFTRLREMITTHKDLAKMINDLEARVGAHDQSIEAIFEAIKALVNFPDKERKVIGLERPP